MRRLVNERPLAGEDDRLRHGLAVLRIGQARPAPTGPQPAQDVVAAEEGFGVLRHDQPAARVGLGPAIEVVRARRLGEPGQQRGLGGRQLPEVADTEVDLSGRGDPVRAVAVEDLVQVGGDDAFLATLPRERRRHPLRLEQLLGLANVAVGARLEVFLRQQARSDELHRDGRCSALSLAAGVLQDGRDDGGRIEALVLPEGAVLDDGRCVEDELRDVPERDDPAALLLEARQLDLARAVVDDGGLRELELLELGRIG